jgi:3-phosphoshikimate 1-carboxyvinyltransferase
MNQPTTSSSRWTLSPPASLRGTARVPGDKSISHRALMLGSLAAGESRVEGFLPSGDCTATIGCMHALGVEIERHDETTLTVHGRGLHGLAASGAPLDCVRSGTTMRLLAGLLAGQEFAATLTGDAQLLRRPMRRVTEPLRRMGARIEDQDGHGPLRVAGSQLHSCVHELNVASAQVKSALLLAGLYADGPTVVRQCGPARDHTELMLAAMGAEVEVDGLDVTIRPPGPLSPLALHVPGDFSSAAYLLVAAALVPGSEVTIREVGVNPTRTGLLDVLGRMGAQVELLRTHDSGGEPVADLVIRTAPLSGTSVSGDTVVRMIDEFPVLAIAATQASGTTVVRDAAELRVKETDRIATIVAELSKMGARIEPTADGFTVYGPTPLRGAVVDSHGDHRLGMALVVAALVAEGESTVEGTDCIADSFPGFWDVLQGLREGASFG